MFSLLDDNFDYVKAVILVYLSWKYVGIYYYRRDSKNYNALFFYGRFRNITILNILERNNIDGPIVSFDNSYDHIDSNFTFFSQYSLIYFFIVLLYLGQCT